MKKIRVLLVEDNRLLREGIAALIKDQPDMMLVSSISNGAAVHRLAKLKPQVVLLDLGPHDDKSLHMVEVIRAKVPSAKVIIMDLVPVQADLMAFVKAGVSGFILKDATFKEFVKTIRSVADGAKVLPPPMTDSLFSEIVQYAARKGKRGLFRSVRMTKREREVVALIAEGKSNKEIADSLHIAVHTVKSHVHSILEKLALHTRLEIASYVHGQNPTDGL